MATLRHRVYVRGADGNLGARVLVGLRSVAGAEIGVASPGRTVGGRWDTIVDVGVGDHDTRARRRESLVEGAAQLVDDALAAQAGQIVVVSSAMVYGAAANNPSPLTENAIVRPDPGFAYARQLAAAEELVDEWRLTERGRRVAVLRPVVTMAADGTSSLARALAAGFGQRFGEDDPDAQFVHLDDLASAVVLAVEKRLDGVYNVAPDGSIPGERVRALTGGQWRIPLPDRVAEAIGALRWRFQRGPIPPGLRSYTREPWVVANDKLRSEGWAPTVTNEQAYVEGTEERWWTMITPKRRQELALGGVAAAGAATAITAMVLLTRWLRRRRRRSG